MNSGKKICGDLNPDDFEVIGEYLMGHFAGSTSAHAAMMGSQGQASMHQLMGKRYTGCANASTNGGIYKMGPAMIDDGSDHGDWGPMMDSENWNWMMGDDWHCMNRQDWRRLQRRWMGTNTAAVHKKDGASMWMYAAFTLAAVVGTLLVSLFRGRRRAEAQAAG